MYFKKMTGKKCYLAPLDVNDAGKYTEWLNDLEVTQNLIIFPQIISIENEKNVLENLSKEHTYSIVDITTNELIGNCGFSSIDHINQTADVGIFIGNKKYWDKGYGTEALSLLLDYGFKALNLHNVFLRVFSFNERAIKSYEKIGFKMVGKKRESILRGKERYDIILMDILYTRKQRQMEYDIRRREHFKNRRRHGRYAPDREFAQERVPTARARQRRFHNHHQSTAERHGQLYAGRAADLAGSGQLCPLRPCL